MDIHGCYSVVKINFAPICMCKNNQQIWCHNNITLHLCDVTGQLIIVESPHSNKKLLFMGLLPDT